MTNLARFLYKKRVLFVQKVRVTARKGHNMSHSQWDHVKYQTIKRMANTIMDRTGSPGYTWLLALMYVCFVLNHTASTTLNNQTPTTILTGSTSDCSPLLRFHWWEEVYFKLDDSDFPSESPELKGHFVGVSEHVGHAMTFKLSIHRYIKSTSSRKCTFCWQSHIDQHTSG